jgi:hypothetical protein
MAQRAGRSWRKAVVHAQAAFRDRQVMGRNRARGLTDKLSIQKGFCSPTDKVWSQMDSVRGLIRKWQKAIQSGDLRKLICHLGRNRTGANCAAR